MDTKEFFQKLSGQDSGRYWVALLFAVGVYVIDFITLWNGYEVYTFLQKGVWLTAIRIFVAIALVTFFTLRAKSKQVVVTELVLQFIWVVFGVVAISNINSILHLILSISIYNFLKKGHEEDSSFTIWIILLTLFDFIGYSAFGSILKNIPLIDANGFSRLYLPLWIYYVLGTAVSETGNGRFTFLLVVLVILNLLLSIGANAIISSYTMPEKESKSVANQLLTDLKSGLGNFWQIFNMSQYTPQTPPGTEEETDYPQGVYLEALDSSEQTFVEGSPINIWANLEARTLDTDIIVKVNCSVETDEEVITGIVDINTGDTFIEIPVSTGVDRAIPCMLEDVPPGDYEVKFSATFDFAADAYRKIYLMDRARYTVELQTLKSNGIEKPTGEDVLRRFDIEDTAPEAIFTSGPIEVGLGTQKVPWDIDESNNNIRPYFGVSVKNKGDKGGKILSINNLYLKIPNTFIIQDLERSCGIKMQDTDEQREAGYTTYKNIEPIPDIEDSKTVNCLLYVGSNSLDNTPVTVRELKTHIDYSYVVEEDISFEVTELYQGDDEVLSRNRVCCEIIGSASTEPSYQWLADRQACLDKNSNTIEADIASSSSLCEEEMCCEVIRNDAVLGRRLVSSQEECTAFGEENNGEGRLLPIEDTYLCD